MAANQTRRSVSLNRDVYAAARRHAARLGIPLAQLIETALAEQGVEPVVRCRRSYTAVAYVRAVQRCPSLERRLLGDALADAMGFR